MRSDYDQAVVLYQAQLEQKPNDPTLTAGLAEVFLRQQKVAEADDLVEKALKQNPQSAILMTALGEVQYRTGTPWLAVATVDASTNLDPCNPQTRLLSARILQLNSYYAAAAKEISTAHALDPHNPRIRSRWLDTLPIEKRIIELEAYLASANGEDPEANRSLHFYLNYLKQQAIEPHKACRLVSNTETASIPFVSLLRDATHIRAFGLDVKLNDHDAQLQIDTGASGLLISRSVADHAGLKQFSRTEVGGIGSQGNKAAYTTFADDIKIGSLEFKDCAVEVVDKGNVADAQSQATAGLQKYKLINGTWVLQYILQDGLNIGVPYHVDNYPASLNPATGGCRNIAGQQNFDGTVTIYAITSTISTNGDTGADPNKLVKVIDRVSDTKLPSHEGILGQFFTVRAANAGEVLRGVALAPEGENGLFGR